MTDYASIEVELKGIKYTTEATDSAGILFLSILFNEDETALIRKGRMEDVVAMYSDRAASRMRHKLNAAKTADEKQKIEDQLNNEIMLELWQRMERDWEIRLLVAERIVELFRFAQPHPIPEKLVFFEAYKEGEKIKYKFNINLSSSDLLGLFTAIVGPTLADLNKKNGSEPKVDAPTSGESSKEQPVAIAPAIEQDSLAEMMSSSTKMQAQLQSASDNLRRNSELTEQKSAIEKLLNSNPSNAVRKVLEEQLNTVNTQMVS